MIRLIAETYAIHPFEIAFFRNIFVLLIFLPWMLRAGRRCCRHGVGASISCAAVSNSSPC